MLLVEFDPQDAVSVPTDCDFQKLRVSKYKVISDITDSRKEINKPVYEANKPSYGSDNDCCEDDDCDYDCNDYNDSDDQDWDDEQNENILAIRNYIENKHEDGEYPTLKQIQSRMKGSDLTCSEILDIVNDLGYYVAEDYGTPKSMWKVEAEF